MQRNITCFTTEDFPLTETEAARLTAEDVHRLQDLFLNGLGEWGDAAETAVEIWRRERVADDPEPAGRMQ